MPRFASADRPADDHALDEGVASERVLREEEPVVLEADADARRAVAQDGPAALLLAHVHERAGEQDRAFAEALDAYKKGRFRYLDVLDAQRTLFELRANYVESLADYHMARIAIEEATAHPLHTGDTAAQENVR